MTTNFRYRDSTQATTAIRRIADHNGLVVVIKTPEEAETDLTAQLAREAAIVDDGNRSAGGEDDNA